MAKLTLADLSQFNTTGLTALNNNWALIEAAVENTLSRDGTTPNTLGANLDANNKRIINLPSPQASFDPVRLIDIDGLVDITGTAVPSMAGNNGKFLQTDGAVLLWAAIASIADTNVTDSGRFAIVASDETITGNWTYSGTLTLNGAVTIDDTLTVTGASSFAANVDLDGGATVNGAEVGTLLIIRDDFSTDIDLAALDRGRLRAHTSATPHTVTIPLNATEPQFTGDGEAISILNKNGTGAVTIAPAGGVTLRIVGTGSTGSRTLAANGLCTLINTAVDEWYVSGTGLT